MFQGSIFLNKGEKGVGPARDLLIPQAKNLTEIVIKEMSKTLYRLKSTSFLKDCNDKLPINFNTD